MSPNGLAASVATLASLFSADGEGGEGGDQLDRAVQVVGALMGGSVLVGLTLGSTGAGRVAAASDARARRLAQARLLDGHRRSSPGADRAARRIDDLADPVGSAAMPELAGAARAEGVRSVLVVPLVDGEIPLGTLELYAEGPGGLGPDAELAAEVLAMVIASGLLAAGRADRSRTEIDQLRMALESRDLIGQAKGILMASRRVDAATAFELLRRASQSRNVKLRDLAELVARTGELPGD